MSAPSSEPGRYTISSLLPSSSTSALSLPSLSSSAYLPASLASLSTTFTSSGTLPASSSTSTTPSTIQRRSQAPPIVISETRRVLRGEFEAYEVSIKEGWERWERERRLGRRGMADLGEAQKERRGSLFAAASSKLGNRNDLGEGEGEGEAMEERRGVEEVLPPLEVVPRIFFEAEFNLANPRTFDLVTEKVTPSPSTTTTTTTLSTASTTSPRLIRTNTEEKAGVNDLATDHILQEKLSHYTAIVESHLVLEISLRSSAFFAALSNLQSLQSQGTTCLASIGELQSLLDEDKMGGGVGGAAKRGLNVLRLQTRRRGLERIERGVKRVEVVWRGVEEVVELSESGEWLGALEVAEHLEALYYGRIVRQASTESRGGGETDGGDDAEAEEEDDDAEKIDLTKVKALDGLVGRLKEMRENIATELGGELRGILEHGMEIGVQEYLNGGWKDDEDGTAGGETRAKGRVRDRIRPVVRGLVRANGVEGAIASWREIVLRDVRSIVKEYLPSNEAGTEEISVADKSLTLANNLKALSHLDFLSLATKTYAGLLGCIEIVQLHAIVLFELISEAREQERLRTAPVSPQIIQTNGSSTTIPTIAVGSDDLSASISSSITTPEDATLLSDLSDVVYAAAELAHLRFSKIISVRTETHVLLPLASFLEIFDATWEFVVRCEVICKRMIVGLRGMMIAQSKAWLSAMHSKCTTSMARGVEEEIWVVVEVERRVQKVVEMIVESAVTDSSELLIGRRRKDDSDGGNETNGETSMAKVLEIEGREYFVVGAGLKAVEALLEYLKVVLNCTLLTTDTMSKVVEFMKSFNSRTCQVVLGAGAMRSAGLKNITAKHLALASQALSVMISLIPYIRETLRRHLNPKQAVMLIEFDKLKRDYQEHQNEIHSKLIAIMGDRLEIHCKTLQSIDWELPAPRPDLPNLYMETLVKEHTTLHKVLSRFLHSSTVEFIMAQVFKALNARLLSEFESIEIRSENGRKRMSGDVVWMKARLEELKGLELIVPGEQIDALIHAKAIIGPPVTLPPPLPPAVIPPPIAAPDIATERVSLDLPPIESPASPSPRPYISRRAGAAGMRASTPVSVPSSPVPAAAPSLLPLDLNFITAAWSTASTDVTPLLTAVEDPALLPVVAPTTEIASAPLPASLPLPLSVPSSPALASNPILPVLSTAIAAVPVVPAIEAPPKRRTMAERLNEIARRGVTGVAPLVSGLLPVVASVSSTVLGERNATAAAVVTPAERKKESEVMFDSSVEEAEEEKEREQTISAVTPVVVDEVEKVEAVVEPTVEEEIKIDEVKPPDEILVEEEGLQAETTPVEVENEVTESVEELN